MRYGAFKRSYHPLRERHCGVGHGDDTPTAGQGTPSRRSAHLFIEGTQPSTGRLLPPDRAHLLPQGQLPLSQKSQALPVANDAF